MVIRGKKYRLNAKGKVIFGGATMLLTIVWCYGLLCAVASFGGGL